MDSDQEVLQACSRQRGHQVSTYVRRLSRSFNKTFMLNINVVRAMLKWIANLTEIIICNNFHMSLACNITAKV